MDIVVNNINKPAFIYQNEENTQLKHNYLKIKLSGKGGNTQGLGAKVWIWQKGNQQYLEQMPSRGFQSTVSSVLHFGLGREIMIDSLRIVWPTGKQQVLTALKGDQQITLQEKNAALVSKAAKAVAPLFTEVSSPVKYKQAANNINDFKRQPLLVHPMSFFGPVLAKGDVNGDGLEDVYAGGGSGQPASLYIQQKGGTFIQNKQAAFEEDSQSEDADAVFFDADGDKYTDLYVASGGYHNYTPKDALLQDRLYINDGKGNFSKAAGALPKMQVSKSCVRITDFNGDGYKDIFTGGRVIPGRYPEIPRSYLLINDGKGHFKDETASLAPPLQKTGMVSDAACTDLNGDGKQDLIVAGEWMPVTVFINVNGKLHDKTKDYFDKAYNGWWNKLLVEDMNSDGKPDLVIGNEGLNTQCKVSDKEPAELYCKDFDDNGSIDPVLCFYMQGKSYPYVTRDELLDQMSIMRTRFVDYKSYADATLKDIFTSEELDNAMHLKANYLKTAYFEMGKDGKFHEKMLPLQAQYSPVFTITSLDYDQDGSKDLLLCGNINCARLRFGKSDANYGTLLKGDGKGGFSYIPQKQSGFHLWGDVRNVLPLNNILLFAINQEEIKAYKLSNE
ncbi:MAG: FG-GAP-like repeat-containing protein [Segetibacter sp.]